MISPGPRKGVVYWVWNDPRLEEDLSGPTGVQLALWNGKHWMPQGELVGGSPLTGVTHYQPLIRPVTRPPLEADFDAAQEWREVEE